MLVDYVVTGEPLVLLAPDLEHYRATRGLYINYDELAGGRWYWTWTDVVGRLDDLFSDPGQLAAAQQHSQALAERFHTHTDGRSAERVAAAAAELGGSALHLTRERSTVRSAPNTTPRRKPSPQLRCMITRTAALSSRSTARARRAGPSRQWWAPAT